MTSASTLLCQPPFSLFNRCACSLVFMLLLSVFTLAIPAESRASQQPPTTSLALDEASLAPVTLQLRWFHQFQFAGYYAAQAKGFYRDAGLNVTIQERDNNQDPLTEVIEGRAQFGVTNSEVLLHALHGEPLIMLAAIFQHSPLALLTKGASNLTTPHDLVNRRVKMSLETRDVELQAMFLNEGMTLDQLVITDGETGKKDYLDKSLDGIAAYVTNQPYYLEQLGTPYNLILPRQYGIDFYGDCLFTSEDMIDNHHGLVQSFAEASLRGWEYAMAHQEEIIDLILEQYPDRKSRPHLTYEAKQLETLILPDLVPLGTMNPGRWKHVATTFSRLGMADEQMITDDFFERFIHSPLKNHKIDSLNRTVRVLWSTVFAVAAVVIILLLITKKLLNEIARRREVESALQQKEEYYRILFEHTGTCSVVINQEGTITKANKKCEGLFKRAPESLVNNAKWQDFVHPVDLKNMIAINARRRAGEDAPTDYDFRFIDAEGAEKDIHVSVGLFPGTNRSICSLNDMTPRILAEREREQVIGELELKNEELERFAYTVSHDLKSPLITIKGFSGLLQEAIEEGDTQLVADSLQRIDGASDTMLNLLDELLRLSRVGRIGNPPVEASLFDIATEAAAHCAGTLKKRNATVTISDTLPIVPCDRTRIFEVFTNLIENAARYGNPDGPTRIEIDHRVDESFGNKEQVFFVRDNGIGIAGQYAERIFNLFEQLNPGGGGTGIGLALVRRIIEHHNGRIWVESKGPGHGSTFCLTLGAPKQVP